MKVVPHAAEIRQKKLDEEAELLNEMTEFFTTRFDKMLKLVVAGKKDVDCPYSHISLETNMVYIDVPVKFHYCRPDDFDDILSKYRKLGYTTNRIAARDAMLRDYTEKVLVGW